MSKNRFKDMVEAKPRVKTGADVEFFTEQFDLAKLLATIGVGRDEMPDKSLLSVRFDLVVEIDVKTRIPLGYYLVRSDQEPSRDKLFDSAS
ncbi:hypothetical protein [Sulfitobacter dubius]|uniref:Uncharacterized protein n=1 Tax=Sulfitobacter dubius TaxID=218673 RepID=A0ABY3ZMH2_9RHOB|nr:hypothetical protein [Sulfitobacter dubius]UOA15865.1 hypothetical protein DSM109990_02711 [Sulfitobacter dubius]